MPDGVEHVKKGRKFDQVLAGARDVFLSVGFEGASVDDIARVSGVSKATLYSYFPDKRILFMEVARIECEQQAQTAIATLDADQPLPDLMRAVGTHLVDFICSEFGQRIFRICIAESERFPDLGRAFYDSGPKTVHDAIVAMLKAKVDNGEAIIDDVELAADQFPELCKANIFHKLLFNLQSEFSEREKARVIDGAVTTFVARYGA